MHNSYANKQQQRLEPEEKKNIRKKKIENENAKTDKNTSKV